MVNKKKGRKRKLLISELEGGSWLSEFAGKLMSWLGDRAVDIADEAEPVVRTIAFETLKQTGRVIWHAPLTSFLTLLATKPDVAIKLATELASGAITSVGLLAKFGMWVYQKCSPAARQLQDVTDKGVAIDKLDIVAYMYENKSLYDELVATNDVARMETLNIIVAALLEATSDMDNVRNQLFLKQFRDDIAQISSPDAKLLRLALTQATTITDEAAGKFYIRNFSWKNYESSGRNWLLALQNRIIEDVKQASSYNRASAQASEVIQQSLAKISQKLEQTQAQIQQIQQQLQEPPKNLSEIREAANQIVEGVKRTREEMEGVYKDAIDDDYNYLGDIQQNTGMSVPVNEPLPIPVEVSGQPVAAQPIAQPYPHYASWVMVDGVDPTTIAAPMNTLPTTADDKPIVQDTVLTDVYQELDERMKNFKQQLEKEAKQQQQQQQQQQQEEEVIPEAPKKRQRTNNKSKSKSKKKQAVLA